MQHHSEENPILINALAKCREYASTAKQVHATYTSSTQSLKTVKTNLDAAITSLQNAEKELDDAKDLVKSLQAIYDKTKLTKDTAQRVYDATNRFRTEVDAALKNQNDWCNQVICPRGANSPQGNNNHNRWVCHSEKPYPTVATYGNVPLVTNANVSADVRDQVSLLQVVGIGMAVLVLVLYLGWRWGWGWGWLYRKNDNGGIGDQRQLSQPTTLTGSSYPQDPVEFGYKESLWSTRRK